MHPLAKRIALLASGFSLVIGLFLLGYNLQFISAGAVSTALNLWPVLVMAAGILLLADSAKKRVTAHASNTSSNEYALPSASGSTELALRVHFSYGRLLAAGSRGEPRLVTEAYGPRPAPVIRHDVVGNRSDLSISISQPIFPSHMTKDDTWQLFIPTGVPVRLSMQLHEADARLDLRQVSLESLDLRTEAGSHEVLLGRPAKKITGQVTCSGSSLSLVLPAGAFCVVRLLNPFCRLDYPQGDMEKREDGSLVTPRATTGAGSVEIDVDGPIRDLVLDIADSEEGRAGGET
jgi:hypothetical protein